MKTKTYLAVILFFGLVFTCCKDKEIKSSNQNREVNIQQSQLERNSKVKIAVIGAGIAGASYTHFITQALGDQCNITVYEKSNRIGGRVKNDKLGGGMIEQGATLIHSSNHYLKHIMKIHNLKPTVPHGGEGEVETLAIWDGQDFRLNTRRNKAISTLQMLWAYGKSLQNLQEVVQETMPKWNEVYDLLQEGYGFETPQSLFLTVDLYDLTQKTSYEYFEEKGIDNEVVYEFVDCISRVNYHQDGNINAFADMVSLAGAGMDGGELFSIEGGNDLLIKNALNSANVNLQLNSEVARIESISESEKPLYRITKTDGIQDTFEIVVIACPLDLTNLELTQHVIKRDRDYQTVHAYFLAGEINYEYFNNPWNDPETIFTIEDDQIPFISIAKTGFAPDWDVPIYKVFSREILDSSFFDQAFNNVKGELHHEWKAYTVLSPMSHWPPFKLGKGLYYINAMESAVSAMESQAVAARNVMNLTMIDLSN